MIPEGRWRAVPRTMNTTSGDEVACQFGESPEKHTPYIAVVFEIVEEGEAAGGRITWYGYFSQNQEATDRTIKALRAIGFTGDELKDMPEQRPANEVELVVRHSENPKSGKVYAEVAFVNALGGGGINPDNQMTPEAVRLFSARMKSRLAGLGGRPASRPAGASKPAASRSKGRAHEPPDDDVPPPTGDEGARDTRGSMDDSDIPF